MTDHIVLKTVADVAAVSVTAASLMSWLPPIAAGLSIIWLTIQIGAWFYDRFLKKDPSEVPRFSA